MALTVDATTAFVYPNDISLVTITNTSPLLYRQGFCIYMYSTKLHGHNAGKANGGTRVYDAAGLETR